MVCIYCGRPTDVTNSRTNKKQNSVWRRRHCEYCGAVFTTYEAADLANSWRVQQTGSTKLAAFNRDKLLLSVYKAVAHRPTALEDARDLCATVIGKLGATQKDGLLVARDVAITVEATLKRFDKAAATAYAAYHAKSLKS